MLLAEGRAIEACSQERAGCEVLHEDVGLGNEATQQRGVVGQLEVEHDRLLATVGPEEIGRVAVRGRVVAAGEIALGALDLDDACAHFGKTARAKGGGERLFDGHDRDPGKRQRVFS